TANGGKAGVAPASMTQIVFSPQADIDVTKMLERLARLAGIAVALGDYETLLGRSAVDGRLRTRNVGLRFDDSARGLASMTFATADLDKVATLIERRAIAALRDNERLTFSAQGVAIRLAANVNEVFSPAVDDEAAAVSALDHVVVRTPIRNAPSPSTPAAWDSISDSTAAIPLGVSGCCSSAAAISWSRSHTI
ncbi:MAG: hypothetical protein ABIO45_17380, partial [Burkholderiaceae bacterium]